MGGLALVAQPFFEELGFEVIDLPKPNRRSIELGIKYAPECACFPLKVVLGDFIIACEMGADYLVILGGGGPCRFGYYGATLDVILKRLGYKQKVLIADRYREPCMKETMQLLGLTKISSKIISSAKVVYRRLKLVEWIQELARKIRPLEVKRGKVDKVLDESINLLRNGNGFQPNRRDIKELFKKIEKDRSRKPLRIGLVGEIYMTLESEANYHIERKLGSLGTLVDRRAVGMLSFILDGLGIAHFRAHRAAKPYLKYSAGGESINSVGYAVLFGKWGYDGIIHISPFGCMPEIVAQTIMDKIGRVYNIPILNIVLDEHTQETGLNTRLEAFVDLLDRRRSINGSVRKCT